MIQKITKGFISFFKLEAASGIVLLFAAIIALIISNTKPLAASNLKNHLKGLDMYSIILSC